MQGLPPVAFNTLGSFICLARVNSHCWNKAWPVQKTAEQTIEIKYSFGCTTKSQGMLSG